MAVGICGSLFMFGVSCVLWLIGTDDKVTEQAITVMWWSSLAPLSVLSFLYFANSKWQNWQRRY